MEDSQETITSPLNVDKYSNFCPFQKENVSFHHINEGKNIENNSKLYIPACSRIFQVEMEDQSLFCKSRKPYFIQIFNYKNPYLDIRSHIFLNNNRNDSNMMGINRQILSRFILTDNTRFRIKKRRKIIVFVNEIINTSNKTVENNNLIFLIKKLRIRFIDSIQMSLFIKEIKTSIEHYKWISTLEYIQDFKNLKIYKNNKNQEFILKTIHSNLNNSSEANITYKIAMNHHLKPFVLNYTKICELSPNLSCIIMPNYALKGCNLKEFIYKKKNNMLKEKQIISLCKQICLAIHSLHKENIIHCDLKLENIFIIYNDIQIINHNYDIRLIDFGFSYDKSNDKSIEKHKSILLGTPGYIAPERIELINNVTDLNYLKENMYLNNLPNEKTDIFSLGIVLYQILSYEHPYDMNKSKNGNISINDQIMYSNLFHSTKWIDISNEAKDLIIKMIHYDPNKRFSSIIDVLNHIWFKIL